MTQQYLIFTLDDSRYAVNVFQIQEVLEYQKPQPIPCTSDLLLGIIRSRNTNISVIDLRKKFSLPAKEPDSQSRIIVIEVTDYDDGVINFYGIIADEVLEVLEIDDADKEQIAKNGNDEGTKFVTDVLSKDNAYTLFIDVNKIFSQDEINAFSGKPVSVKSVIADMKSPETKTKKKPGRKPAKTGKAK